MKLDESVFLTLEEVETSTYKKAISWLSKIDPCEIEEALAQLPAIYGYYAGLLADAKEAISILTLKLEKLEAQVRRKNRIDLKTKGSKITEKILDAETYLDVDFLELKTDIIKSETKYNLVRNILTTLEYKKDMLIQLSVNARQEKKMFT